MGAPSGSLHHTAAREHRARQAMALAVKAMRLVMDETATTGQATSPSFRKTRRRRPMDSPVAAAAQVETAI